MHTLYEVVTRVAGVAGGGSGWGACVKEEAGRGREGGRLLICVCVCVDVCVCVCE